jgi:hypothetical protein
MTRRRTRLFEEAFRTVFAAAEVAARKAP